jgi:hypothetical protein
MKYPHEESDRGANEDKPDRVVNPPQGQLHQVSA